MPYNPDENKTDENIYDEVYSEEKSSHKPHVYKNSSNQLASSCNARRSVAYSIGGIAITGITGIFGISVAAAVSTAVSGAIASKIALIPLVAALAMNPIAAGIIAGCAGAALIGIFGFAAYNSYQAHRARQGKKKIKRSDTFPWRYENYVDIRRKIHHTRLNRTAQSIASNAIYNRNSSVAFKAVTKK